MSWIHLVLWWSYTREMIWKIFMLKINDIIMGIAIHYVPVGPDGRSIWMSKSWAEKRSSTSGF